MQPDWPGPELSCDPKVGCEIKGEHDGGGDDGRDHDAAPFGEERGYDNARGEGATETGGVNEHGESDFPFGNAAHQEGQGEDGHGGEPHQDGAVGVDEAFGDHNMPGSKWREKQQAQGAFAPFLADAIGGGERNKNPNDAEQNLVDGGEEAAAVGVRIEEPSEPAYQQDGCGREHAVPVVPTITRADAKFSNDDWPHTTPSD